MTCRPLLDRLTPAVLLACLVSLACASRPATVPDETTAAPPPPQTPTTESPTTESPPTAEAPRTNVDAPSGVPLVDITPERFIAKIREPGASAVLVNVWATWCDPCREEFPDLLRIRETYGPRGLRTLFLSADFEDEREDVEEFLASQGVDFETYLRSGEDHAFIDAIHPAWGGTLPATLVRDSEGELLLFREGVITYDELDALLAPRL